MRDINTNNTYFDSLSKWVKKYTNHSVNPNDIVTKTTVIRNGIPTVTRDRLIDKPAKCMQALNRLKKEYKSENVVRATLRSQVVVDTETMGYDSISVETVSLYVEMATPTGRNKRHVELKA